MQHGHGQERERALVRRGAGHGQLQGYEEVRLGLRTVSRRDAKLTEQAMGGDEGERLARRGGEGQGGLGLASGQRGVAGLRPVARPELRALGATRHRPAPRQPALVGLKPRIRRREVAGVEGQRGGDALHR